MENTCVLEQRLDLSFAQKATKWTPKLEQRRADLSWKIIGCQKHQGAEPCANKKERGIPAGASCNKCPLEKEIEEFEKTS